MKKFWIKIVVKILDKVLRKNCAKTANYYTTFLKCCITNAIDRTEDDLLWQDEDDTDPFNDEDAEVVDEEGELYYVEQDETSAVELSESDYRCISGNSDDENDFEGF